MVTLSVFFMTVFLLLRKFSVITFLVLFGDPDFFIFGSDSECLLLECHRLISSGAPFLIFNPADAVYFHKTHKTVSICNFQGPKDFNFIFDIQNSISASTLRKAKLIVTADTGHYKIEDDRTWLSS